MGTRTAPPRILVVDDERYNRELLEVMLVAEGYVVQSAVSGQEALTMVAADPPDLILLDIMMPGMDGYQVALRVKSNPAHKNIPIIIFTALDDRNSRMHGLNAGAEDFLTKPVDRAELSLRVRNLLRLKSYSDEFDRYSKMLEGEVVTRGADLRESVSLYESTFDASPVGIVQIGLDGTWLRANRRLGELLGYEGDELEGKHQRELMHADQVFDDAAAFTQMAQGTLDRYVNDERRFQRKDGTSMWARVTTAVHRDASRRAQRFISVIEDVTELRTLEAQVRQAGKMDAVGRLASGVAHDFNNLLTVIMASADVISATTAGSGAHEAELTDIRRATESAAALTRQLLAFSRQQVLNTTAVDINALLREMNGMFGRLIGDTVQVTLALDETLVPALADHGQLQQVLMNLVVNARDAMQHGGKIVIATANVELENSAFHVETISPGQYVMVSVSDSGEGMTRETQRRLFEPFFTTKEAGRGTGLGLSTTYGIVKQSKGYIWVYSEIGKGTTFKVYFPRAQRGVESAVPSSPVDASILRGSETVLLVEDEEHVRRLVAHMLENAGYDVVEAASGDDAERTFAARANGIDVVVTDMVMPGLGGAELLKRLRVRKPSLRAVVMSGHTDHEVLELVNADTIQVFVQKPFTSAELTRQMRALLDLR